MTTAPPNPYLRTKVLTAGPSELRLLLIDGAIRFAEQGRQAIAAKDHEAAFNSMVRAQRIVMELLNSLRPEHAPDLCEKLSGLYTFMYTRLVTAASERDVAIVDEVLDLLRYERETWLMLMEQLAGEKAGPGDPGGAISVRG